MNGLGFITAPSRLTGEKQQRPAFATLAQRVKMI
jgi:hypothetical protein